MNKRFYFGFLGLLGFMGFEDPWYFLFFLFFLFFLQGKKKMPELAKRQAEEKAEHKQKILEFAQGRERITNNDIEKLLGVSNATAERYLDQLEEEGLLKQVGRTGRDVFYSKN